MTPPIPGGSLGNRSPGREPLRVLHVTSTPSAAGGAERLLLDMVRHYDRDAFAFSYCNLFFEKSSFVDALRAAGEDVTVIPGMRFHSLPAVVTRLVRHLRRIRPDLVHTHMLHASVAGQFAAALARVPARLVTRHYTDDVLSAPRRAAERFVLRRATRVLSVSEAVAANLRAGGVDPGVISVVHNGIDLQRFDGESARVAVPPWPAEWADAIVIGSVGNLFAYKGYDVLLRAFAAVHRQEPRVRLVVIGEGRERAALTALAGELGVAAFVAFPGRSPDVPTLLRSLSLYVQPSLSESFGIAVAEAMAARLPVVATTAGGLPEVVADGETGLLVPPADSSALAGAILRLVRDGTTARMLGQRGRLRVEANFSIAITVREAEAIYRAVSQ